MSAIVVPGVNYRQLSGKSKTLLVPRVINVHTMVGGLAGVERYFAGSGNPYSHFGTGYDGEIRQWQDLRYRAASDLNGNPYCISIENADSGTGFPVWSGSNVPRFTDKQADSLVVLLSWLCHRFNIPKELIATSCPHERGVGYHRLGVDPYRNTKCGHLWSRARGKVCPGDRRIRQLQTEIIPRVSSPVSKKEFLMALSDAEQKEILTYLRQLRDGAPGFGVPPLLTSVTETAYAVGGVDLGKKTSFVSTLSKKIDGIPAAVVKALPAGGTGGSGGLTEAQIEAAVRKALVSVFNSLK